MQYRVHDVKVSANGITADIEEVHPDGSTVKSRDPKKEKELQSELGRWILEKYEDFFHSLNYQQQDCLMEFIDYLEHQNVPQFVKRVMFMDFLNQVRYMK